MTAKAVAAAGAGEGPQFLEFRTYRWREHCGPDFDNHLNYRSEREAQEGMADCPIERYKAALRQRGVDADSLADQIEEELRHEIRSAFEFSDRSPNPVPADARARVYA
jgi:pyruvate dehydrogenase E1 component alpha subunit